MKLTSLHITGTTGFVGSNLIEFLKDYPINRINLREALITDVTVDDGDVYIHLAGKAHDLKNVDNADEYYEVNFQKTVSLYNAFLKSKASKFIFISSVKAVADQVEGFLTEQMKANPATHYGKSKLMAEEYIQKQPLPTGKAYYILRPCMIHGPGNKGNLNLLYQVVKNNIPYPLAKFTNQRSFLSIDNLCFVIGELIVRNDIPSGIYNLADDEPISTNRLIELISESLGKKPKLWNINRSVIIKMAQIGSILKLPLTTERLQKLTENYLVSNQKIKNAINKPLPITSQEGIIMTVQSFQKTK